MTQYEKAVALWHRKQVRTDAELSPLVEFLKAQTAKTWQKQIERAERRDSGRN